MARYTGADCKRRRREGIKLFLKGDRCDSDKCAVEAPPKPPGRGWPPTAARLDYRVQLREKQRANVRTACSRSSSCSDYALATRHKGIKGENLLRLLESRLDNVVSARLRRLAMRPASSCGTATSG